MIYDLLQFLIGLVLIYFSAELIIKYGKYFASSIGVSKYFIGLTLVAFGTSFPEFVVSINASFRGNSEIAYGNVVGSNIANIALVLSICSVLINLKSKKIKNKDLYFFLFSGVLVFIFSLNGFLSELEAICLLSLFIVYSFLLKKDFSSSINRNDNLKKFNIDIYYLIILACSFFILIEGSNYFIESAVKIATRFNISNVAISMTMIAIGTSIPELATSIIAVYNKENELLIGNIIGSNIMNILMILGPSALINNIVINDHINSLVLMLILTIIVFTVNIFKINFSRVLGLIFLLTYTVFVYTNFRNVI